MAPNLSQTSRTLIGNFVTEILRSGETCFQPRRYDKLVSIGRYCQTAYQLRRFTNNTTASFFDWLGTPHDGLIRVLQRDFLDCFLLENLVLSEDGLGVVDQTNGIDFRHTFSNPRYSHSIDLKIFALNYEVARQKADFLRLRWRKTIRRESTLYVRQDSPSPTQIRELYDALAMQASPNRIGLLIVTPSSHPPAISLPDVYIESGPDLPTSPVDWKGTDEAWDRILTKYCTGASR